MSSSSSWITTIDTKTPTPPFSFTMNSSSDQHPAPRGSGVPKFKTIPPPSLPISPPAISPSSYFAFPAGLSPAELLDSPVLLASNNILPSPTTGSFPFHAFNWKNLSTNILTQEQTIKTEQKSFSNHSTDQQIWNHENQTEQTFSPEISTLQTESFQSAYVANTDHFDNQTTNKKSEDGFNWRKYGQKQVKGSQNPRSYYKCTYPNCSMKKKLETNLQGQITEIVYKGNHSHPKPQSTRRSSSSSGSNTLQMSQVSSKQEFYDYNDQSYASHGSHGSAQFDSVTTPENSPISVGDDEFDRSLSGGDDHDVDQDEPDSKRWKVSENEGISMIGGTRTVREPRVVVQTTSDIDILDDGYRWRKYGQKVVKGNPNPRSYYKCTNTGCSVRKHVERASPDLRSVITSYEGKHNHDVPMARGSGHRLQPTMAIKPTTISDYRTNNSTLEPVGSSRFAPLSDTRSPFTLDMLQNRASFKFPSFENALKSNRDSESEFSGGKEEPRDDMFLESLLF